MEYGQVVEILEITLLKVQVEAELLRGEVDSVESEMLRLGQGGDVGIGLVEAKVGPPRV
jgi:hypothetical protein